MLAQILVAILIVAVAVMVGVDIVRTKTEDPSGQPDGSGYEVRAEDHRRHSRRPRRSVSPSRQAYPLPDMMSVLGQHPGRADPIRRGLPAPARRLARGPSSSAERDGVPRAQGNRHVRSRLQLMVVIPVAAVTVIALCIVGLAYFLSGARIYAPDGSVRVGAILWAVAIVIVMITVLVLAVWATIGTARSVLQPLYRLRSRAMALAERSAVRRGARRCGFPGRDR